MRIRSIFALIVCATLSAFTAKAEPKPRLKAKNDALQARYEACMAHYKEKRYQEARACLQKFVVDSPTSQNAHYYIAMSSYALGDLPAARAAFARVLELQPADRDARAHLVDVLIEQNDVDGAIAQARLGDEREPRWLGWKERLVPLYHAKGDLAAAGATRQKLFELRNKDGISEGLTSPKLYVRERLKVGDATVNAIEYFTADRPEGPKYSFWFKRAGGSEYNYKLEYHRELDAIAAQLGEKKKGGAPLYALDMYQGDLQVGAGFFDGDPGYFKVRDAAIAHFKKVTKQ